MTCTNCPPIIQKYGADPANVQWVLVRGDTAVIRVDFLELNETAYDTTGWTYASTAYDPIADVTHNLNVDAVDNYVTITAPAGITELWGTGANAVVAELSFDLEVTIPVEGEDDTIWTPVIGTICVLGDITGGSL
jgi:hypothetical protein